MLSSKNFSDIITFSRASAGWCYNSAGVLTQVASGAPRFDYDPVTKAIKGLLIEEQRTNMVLNSDGTVAQLSASAGVANATSAVAAYFANSIQFPASSGSNSYAYKAVTTVSSTAYTLSVFAKMDDGSVPVVTQSINAPADFCLVTDNGVYSNPVQILHMGDGVYRISMAYTVPTGRAGNFGVMQYSTNSGKAFRITGYQVEAGSFPTSYMPTAGSQVTRAADVASVNTLSPWFNSSAGTILLEYTKLHALTAPAREYLLMLSDSGLNRLAVRAREAGDNKPLFVVSDGVGTGTLASTIANTGTMKVAAAYSSSDSAISANGEAAVVQARGFLKGGETAIYIGGFTGSNYLNGHIRKLQYFPKRLTNAELQALTA